MINSSNQYLNGYQPAFLFYANSSQNSVTGDGTAYTVIFNTQVENVGSVFDGTSTFTAPQNATYVFNFSVQATIGSGHTSGLIQLVAFDGITTFNYNFGLVNPYAAGTGTAYAWTGSLIIPLVSGTTMKVVSTISGGTKTASIAIGSSNRVTTFSGFLLS